MAKTFRFLLLQILNLLLLSSVSAQSDHFVYAVTDIKKDGAAWIALRKLDLRTGEFSTVLLDGTNKKANLLDAATKKITVSSLKDTNNIYQPQLPFGTGVSAIAYDRKNRRIFFAPMFVDQLRYIDLETMQVFCVSGKGFYNEAGSKLAATNALPRMVIAGDGNGYSISNDGNHLYRFSTSGTPVITDLGSLIDHPGNNQMTIHNACGNGGGDMIADNDGHLYLFTAQNGVYKVTINTLETTWLGKISGLPEKFASNGAAVDGEGRILIGSSVYNEAWYTIDPSDWKAKEFKPVNGLFRSADLANSNLLFAKRSSKNNQPSVIPSEKNSLIRLYPNPAEKNRFTVYLTNLEPGDYSLHVTDILGRTVIEKKIGIQTAAHTETVVFPPKTSVGLYLVRIVNRKNNQVFSEKLMLNHME